MILKGLGLFQILRHSFCTEKPCLPKLSSVLGTKSCWETDRWSVLSELCFLQYISANFSRCLACCPQFSWWGESQDIGTWRWSFSLVGMERGLPEYFIQRYSNSLYSRLWNGSSHVKKDVTGMYALREYFICKSRSSIVQCTATQTELR